MSTELSMVKVELFVGLKIPDTTAITTFQTIKKMGYVEIKKVKRELYYKFEIEGDVKQFVEKIGKVDILVNANKNKFSISFPKEKIRKEEEQKKQEEQEGCAVNALVKDRNDKCEALLYTLHKRLGLNEIKKIEKGVLWTLYIDSDLKKAEEIAQEIGNKLLHNEHYQVIEYN